MKNLIEQKKTSILNGMNNKGFSLVELIIVVAIMSVLMGVLAPQYLRFVESSREQKDVSAANEIVKAITIATAMLSTVPLAEIITWNEDGSLSFYPDQDSAFAKEIRATLGDNIGAISSTKYQSITPMFAVGRYRDSGTPFIYEYTNMLAMVMVLVYNMADLFFLRGGNYYNGASGLFAFNVAGGGAGSNLGFRAVLVEK